MSLSKIIQSLLRGGCLAAWLAFSSAGAAAQNVPLSQDAPQSPRPSLAPFSSLAQLASLPEEEKRLWGEADDADQSIRRRDALYGDAQLDAYLQTVLDGLYPEFKGAMRIRTISDPDLNAFAMPNGSIYINLGLLARLSNEAQLATVLAHEGAHFIERHGYQQRKNAQSTSVFALGISMVGGVAGLLGQVAAASSIYGFSREHEHEADRIGFERMVKQGYDTQQGLKVFGLLRDEAKLLDYKEPFMFASHPKLSDRVRNFQELRAADPLAQAAHRIGEERFVRATRQARLAWIDQAFGLSRYSSVIYVLEQPGAKKRFPAYYSYYLGEAYRLRNQKDDQAKALAAYRQAQQAAPDYAPIYRALGMLQMQEGEKNEARTMFQQYLAMAPNAGDVAFVQTYLQQIR